MDINVELERLIIKWNIDECIPKYKSFVMARNYLRSGFERLSMECKKCAVIGSESEVKWYNNYIAKCQTIPTIIFENGIMEEADLSIYDGLIVLSMCHKDEIFIMLANLNYPIERIYEVYSFLKKKG